MRDIMGMMGKVKEMQAKMEKMQEEIAALEIEGKSGGGLVTVARVDTGLPLPPPVTTGDEVRPPRAPYFGTPRPGQLTPLWIVLTAVLWVCVFLALTGVLKASQELGLATWWLGPFSDPNPLVLRLLPFYAPTVMVIVGLSNFRWLPLAGLFASAVTLVIGFLDLGDVRRLGLVEVAIGVAAAVFSLASLTAMYRSPADPSP
jgi:hypothetical protein